MALYDNKHWLLSHIRNSFISSDDTGMCEMVMLGEDIPRKLSNVTKFDCYPGVDESDEEEDEMDVMGQSFDIQSDIDFGIHRQRSSTAQRLEKMDQDRKKTNRIKHIKWEWSPVILTDEERAGLFERKNFKQDKNNIHIKKHSLLSEQLEKCPNLPQNPFVEYAKYDGNAQIGVPTRKYGIFLTMLEQEERNYPMHVVVLAQAKVQDLIGLICWKYTLEHGQHKLKDSVDNYGLYIAEDDGEVDWDFPCLDPRETVGKFGFNFLALVERQRKDEDSKSIEREESEVILSQEPWFKPKSQQQEMEDLIRMQGHMIAMEAPLYQSYRVYIINKVRAKTEIHLGVSGEKIEIDPVIQQKVSAKFWNRQKAVSYDMDSIAACDLTDTKSSSRSTFRLVYHHSSASSGDQAESLQHHTDLASYKHHDFEAEQRTAEEIVQKINHILELRSSVRRKEYLALRERKSHRKRSFHLGPR
ncbi:target of rapamycin complex 2 subunit MAPKAP1 isoform X2 [Periplaneta americana]|uniref:target of rapamycin complex 2 subunit MAPKAP1 isoform X2 n=1 Tax=Periplaneta americana TaxID=6978 RepID=UPI0037E88847